MCVEGCHIILDLILNWLKFNREISTPLTQRILFKVLAIRLDFNIVPYLNNFILFLIQLPFILQRKIEIFKSRYIILIA